MGRTVRRAPVPARGAGPGLRPFQHVVLVVARVFFHEPSQRLRGPDRFSVWRTVAISPYEPAEVGQSVIGPAGPGMEGPSGRDRGPASTIAHPALWRHQGCPCRRPTLPARAARSRTRCRPCGARSGCRRTGSCGWATRTIRSGRAARRRCRSGSRPAKVVIRLEREGILRRRGYEVGIAPPQAPHGRDGRVSTGATGGHCGANGRLDSALERR
jgi:hypothetical protein